MLQAQYWAEGIPKEIVETSIESSFCFGVYKQGRQIGFARVVTDFAVFAYLADVFIDSEEQQKGYAGTLINDIMNHTALQTIKRWHLLTRDAQNFYRKFGFEHPVEQHRHMELIKKPSY